ncbi:MAG: outer membrane protein assembly factor BamE [Bdellovibrionaceae bacterium]|nr:outer membrane protein assembly factor BamE [Pseudobdellovibrionaceae bacterium]MDW8189874.1 hypothetical protein [Pseudobdellovibrionaceae bacterium]
MTKIWFLVAMLVISSCIQVRTRFERSKYENSKDSVSVSRHTLPDDVRLKLLENSLKGKNEIEQYGKALPYFHNASEKIYFLSLPTFKERQKWLNETNFWSRIEEKNRIYARYIEEQDIALGMTADLVRRAWGDPQEIAVSGIIPFGNMIWTYSSQETDSKGFRSRKRIVYFEDGQVVGWDSQ